MNMNDWGYLSKHLDNYKHKNGDEDTYQLNLYSFQRDSNKKCRCICGQFVLEKNLYTLRNNGKCIIVGNECIKKNSIELYEETKKINKKIKKCKENITKFIETKIKKNIYMNQINLRKSFEKLKSLIPKKCLECKCVLKNIKFNKCYNCNIKNKDKCKCGKLKDKKYELCYTCKEED